MAPRNRDVARRRRPVLVLVLVLLSGLFGVACGGEEKAPIEALPVAEQPTNFVEGVIELAPELADKASPTDSLFIFLRKPVEGQTGRGAPMATLKATAVKFPYKFILTDKNRMFDNLEFAAPMTLHARLSKSGNPIGIKGDIEGDCVSNPVAPGQRGLKVVLDREITEDRQSPMNRPANAPDYE